MIPNTARGIELSIIVPTYCERGNISQLVELIEQALAGVEWEVIFVDDNSSDGTADRVWETAQTDRRIRCLKRVGRRGLSSACIEGLLASPAPVLAVMDADLQHDPALLRTMLARIHEQNADLVVASRYIEGGSVGDWDGGRVRISRFATRLAGIVSRQPLSDPMSGYFMLKRKTFYDALPRLSSLGFKILLDIVASSPDRVRLVEIPLIFRRREHGESKLSAGVAWEYLLLIGDKLLGRFIPVRFVAFGAVGGAGAAVHFAVLTLLFKVFGTTFEVAQASAVITAMLFNYTINNLLTYGDVMLRGARWWKGLLSFAVICGIGAVANVGIASFLFNRGDSSWELAAIAGILVGSVWNYAVTARYTWKNV